MKQLIFKRSRNAWDSEFLALNDVCEKQNINVDVLIMAHTTTHWIWKVAKTVQDIEILEKPRSLQIDKQEFSEQEALANAMEHFETFESNLLLEHSNTHWGFRKLRG